MFNSCVCVETDAGEYTTILDNKLVVARKNHQCSECRDTINKNEKYESIKYICEGDIFHHKTCLPCYNMRESLFKCGWFFGMIWEDLLTTIGDDMTFDEDEDDPNWRNYILPKSLRVG